MEVLPGYCDYPYTGENACNNPINLQRISHKIPDGLYLFQVIDCEVSQFFFGTKVTDMRQETLSNQKLLKPLWWTGITKRKTKDSQVLNRVFILGLLLATSSPAIAQEINHEPVLVAGSQSISPYGLVVFYFNQSGETYRGAADCNKDLVEYRVQIESGDWILNEVKESAEYKMLATACNLDED